MKKIYSILFLTSLSLVIFFVGCKNDNKDNSKSLNLGDLSFPNDASTANNRMLHFNDPVGFVVPVTGEKSGQKSTIITNKSLDYLLVAELPTPSEEFSATHVVIDGRYAYVSYHTQGNPFGGGIEIIDLSDPSFPSVASRMFYAFDDINALAIDHESTVVGGKTLKKLYLAGSSNKKGALLTQITLENGLFNPASQYFDYKEVVLPGASANGVIVSEDKIFVTTGATAGGAFILNKETLEFVETSLFQNAKYIDIDGTANGSNIVWFQASPNAYLHSGKVEGPYFQNNLSIGNYFYPGNDSDIPDYRGKSTIRLKNGLCYVAMGDMGLKIFDIDAQNSEAVYTLPKPVNGTTNAVNLLDDFILIANGSAGLYVATLPTDNIQTNQLSVLGIYEFNKSTNFVAADDRFIIIANGKDGIKILAKQTTIIGDECPPDENGLPSCVVWEDVCSDILAEIPQLFYERRDAMVYHPEFFTYPRPQYLYLNKNAEVKITFLSEGASYRNSLGYFVYDINNPPTDPKDLDVTIIFPNASKINSGGSMLLGHTVSLGVFPANTAIGFMMYSNGWRNNVQTQGHFQVYSLDKYNVAGKPQSVFFMNETCQMLGLAFEDIPATHANSDRDFNDVIVGIKTYPTDALTLPAIGF